MDDASAPVLVDTDVWSILFSRKQNRDSRLAVWRRALMGRELVIATQTRAEVLAGALSAGWSAPSLTKLREQLAETATVPVDGGLVETYAQLTADLRRIGHALHQKHHTGDRWVAATAVRHGLELCSGDAIYDDVPGLSRLTVTPTGP